MGFAEEALDWVQIAWGTHEKPPGPGMLVPKDGPMNQVFIPMHAMDMNLYSYVPDTPITGMCIPHGESDTISQYFTVVEDQQGTTKSGNERNKEHSIYRPSVYYVYNCAKVAVDSLQEIRNNDYRPQIRFHVLTRDELVQGEDRVGSLLCFEKDPVSTLRGDASSGHAWCYWYGSILGAENTPIAYSNPTVIQVGCSVMSALQWMIANPRKGVCWPEDLPHKEVLRKSTPSLGKIVSQRVPFTPPSSLQFEEFLAAGVPN
jgi:homospermidine synthase